MVRGVYYEMAGGLADTRPAFRPTEYRCYIKESLHYGAAGADSSSRANALRLSLNSPF